MNNGFLGIGSCCFITYGSSCTIARIVEIRAGFTITESIMPCVPYLIFAAIVFLKIIDEKEIARREAPEVTDPRAIRIYGVNFVYTPVIGCKPRELARIIALIAQCNRALIFR